MSDDKTLDELAALAASADAKLAEYKAEHPNAAPPAPPSEPPAPPSEPPAPPAERKRQYIPYTGRQIARFLSAVELGMKDAKYTAEHEVEAFLTKLGI